MGPEQLVACARCGVVASSVPGGLAAGWSLATEARRLVHHCGTCTRANLRAIEGRLDEEWWEG